MQLAHEVHSFPTLQLHGAHGALAESSAILLLTHLSHQCCPSGHDSYYTISEGCFMVFFKPSALHLRLIHIYTPNSGISKFCSSVSQSVNPALLFLISPVSTLFLFINPSVSDYCNVPSVFRGSLMLSEAGWKSQQVYLFVFSCHLFILSQEWRGARAPWEAQFFPPKLILFQTSYRKATLNWWKLKGRMPSLPG